MDTEKKIPKIVFSPADGNEVPFEVVSIDDISEYEDVYRANKDAIVVLGTAKSQCNGSGITHTG